MRGVWNKEEKLVELSKEMVSNLNLYTATHWTSENKKAKKTYREDAPSILSYFIHDFNAFLMPVKPICKMCVIATSMYNFRKTFGR